MKISGNYIAQTNAFIPNSRLSWVGKERDDESNLGDYGVRKYEPEAGRFLSIDPLWEKHPAWTPYQYCGNDPLNKTDLDGMAKISNYIVNNYHRLAFIVQYILPKLAENPKFVDAMQKATDAPKSAIKEYFTFGEGTLVKLKNIRQLGMTNDCTEAGINKYKMDDLEIKDRDNLDDPIETMVLFTVNLLSHEIAQALWHKYGKQGRNNSDYNPGAKFEKLFHGFPIKGVPWLDSTPEDPISHYNEVLKTYGSEVLDIGE